MSKLDNKPEALLPKRLFGRNRIYTNELAITRNNIAKVITEITPEWEKNRGEICYLYDYYKGKQPCLYRTKNIREDICNQIVENRAKEIVDFKTGYLCGSPIQYVSRNSDVQKSEEVDRLNSYMATENKSSLDKELIEWQMICGTSYRMCLPDDMAEQDDCPFELFVLDPRNTFIIYSNDYRKKPLAAIYYTTEERLINGGTKPKYQTIHNYSVYTSAEFMQLEEDKVVRVLPHTLGMIPIIEYPANESRMGAFEPVLPLLDTLNDLDSNRMDGVEQFVQSLMILYNCQLPDGEDASSLQAKGLIELKSTGDNKADVKILSEQLNQTETQTLKVDLLSAIREISGVPAQGDGNSSDSSNNGAVVLKNGWQSAESMAKSSELMFKKAETDFLKLVLNICNDDVNVKPFSMNLLDIETKFTRNCYDNILSKSQTLVTLLQTEKVAPQIAFNVCGLFSDSEEAYLLSKKYIEEQSAKEPEVEPIVEATITETGMNNGEEEIEQSFAD